MTEAPQLGDCGPLFEDVAETMDVIRVQAEIGTRYAAIGDDIGLAYVLRNLVAYVRSATPVVKACREAQDRRREREAPRKREVADGPR